MPRPARSIPTPFGPFEPFEPRPGGGLGLLGVHGSLLCWRRLETTVANAASLSSPNPMPAIARQDSGQQEGRKDWMGLCRTRGQPAARPNNASHPGGEVNDPEPRAAPRATLRWGWGGRGGAGRGRRGPHVAAMHSEAAPSATT